VQRPFDPEAALEAVAPGELPVEAFSISIDRDGTWWHDGQPIRRIELVKLLASVLRRDAAGNYRLVTPAERGRIEVADVPFLAVELAVDGEGRARVVRLRTNLDDWIPLDAEHPLRLAPGPVPHVRVRERLEARLLTSVCYELAERAEPGPEDGRLGVWTSGRFFPLEPAVEATGSEGRA
jgi:hypothetical protein